MAFKKEGKAEGVKVLNLEMEIDKTASFEQKKSKKESFVKMEKPVHTASEK